MPYEYLFTLTDIQAVQIIPNAYPGFEGCLAIELIGCYEPICPECPAPTTCEAPFLSGPFNLVMDECSCDHFCECVEDDVIDLCEEYYNVTLDDSCPDGYTMTWGEYLDPWDCCPNRTCEIMCPETCEEPTCDFGTVEECEYLEVVGRVRNHSKIFKP